MMTAMNFCRPAAVLVALALLAGTAWAEEEIKPLAERGYALGDVVLGEEDAPVTMIEYASFTCSHCATFHRETYPQVKSEYIDTGRVRFILREVYFDGEGLLAGRLSRCTGPKGYYALVDLFFSSQSDWIGSSNIGKELYRRAVRAGVPADRLKACVEDQEFALALLESFQSHREEDDIEATPTILIGGERVEGAAGFEQISEMIEQVLDN